MDPPTTTATATADVEMKAREEGEATPSTSPQPASAPPPEAPIATEEKKTAEEAPADVEMAEASPSTTVPAAAVAAGSVETIDLGFVPSSKGVAVGSAPAFNTCRLDLSSWKQTCDQVLGDIPGVSETTTSDNVKHVVETVLTTLAPNPSETKDALPLKLCYRYFEDASCLKVLITLVLLPLVTELQMATIGDLLIPGNLDRSACVMIMNQFSEKLTANALQKKKKVFISPEVAEQEALELKKVVTRLGGLIVPSAAFPGVTHIVVNRAPPGSQAAGSVTLETAKAQGRIRVVSPGPIGVPDETKVVVHWVGYPNSFDEVVPSGSQGMALMDKETEEERKQREAAAKRRERAWHVSTDWVSESERHREWMCEADFEVLCTEDYGAHAVEVITPEEIQKLEERTRIMREMEQKQKAEKRERERRERERKEREKILMQESKKIEQQQEREMLQAAKRAKKQQDRDFMQLHGAKRAKQDQPGFKPQAAEDAGAALTLSPFLPPQTEGAAPSSQAGTATGVNGSNGVGGAGASSSPPVVYTPVAPPVTEKMELFRVPAHSAWFKWNEVHDIERGTLPEFFNNKSTLKTPRAYKEYRDFIIDKFRRQPRGEKITFTQCRKFLSGDVNAIYRVYAFLEHWGLINFDPNKLSRGEVMSDAKAKAKDGAPGAQASGDKAKEERAALGFALPAQLKIVTTKRGYNVDSLVNLGPHQQDGNPNPGVSALTLVTKRRQGVSPAQPATDRVKFVCNISGKECEGVRYHCTKIPDYDLSEESFAELRKGDKPFPPGITETDFVRMDASKAEMDPERWTKEETLLLLEGLETFGENWAEVAEHVGTKSQLQCITFFLSLPIEDPYLDDLQGHPPAPVPSPSSHKEEEAGEDARLGPSDEVNPFVDTGNPVMAQVAFLATMIGPKVAAAAARKALDVLFETEPALGNKDKQPATATDKAAAEPAAAAGASGSGAGAMEVDGAGEPGEKQYKGASEMDEAPSAAKAKAAMAAGLAAAAVKAKLLADKEEQEIQKLVVAVIEKQMTKLESKMSRFEELDGLLERERDEIYKARQMLLMEKIEERKEQIEKMEKLKKEEEAKKAAAEKEKAREAAEAAAAAATATAAGSTGAAEKDAKEEEEKKDTAAEEKKAEEAPPAQPEEKGTEEAEKEVEKAPAPAS